MASDCQNEVLSAGCGDLGRLFLSEGGIKTGFKVGSRAIARNALKKVGKALPRGVKAFREYKLSRVSGGLVGEIDLIVPHKFYGTKFPVNTEYSHRFITQRAQRNYNLPNWLVNNRLNVQKTNTLIHAQHDFYRFRFLPREIKRRLGPGGDLNYNLFR